MEQMINLTAALERIKQIAVETGLMQKQNLGRKDLGIHTKSTGIDLVTEVDKKAEEMIIHFIHTHYPDHGILAEESGLNRHDSDYLWIIDPLDGTTNYSQGLPIFVVSIALQYKGETVLGVIYCPVTGQLFSAIKGHGAYLDGDKIQVSAKSDLATSVLATGFPYDIATHPVNNITYFQEIVLKARAVRRMGAAAYDLALVAAGKFDGFWEMSLSPWDVAAGVLLIQEAGGTIVYFREDRGISLIAGNETVCRAIHGEIERIEANRSAK
jgi:myo-inositol-1(or 4)-monophosphatase